MSNQVTGKLVGIKPIGKRGEYDIRQFLLDTSNVNESTGVVYENMLMLEFWGDNCAKLDGFQVGQEVTVSYNLRGSKDKATQKWRWVNVNPWKIELAQVQQTQQPQNFSNQNTKTTAQTAAAPVTNLVMDDLPF